MGPKRHRDDLGRGTSSPVSEAKTGKSRTEDLQPGSYAQATSGVKMVIVKDL